MRVAVAIALALCACGGDGSAAPGPLDGAVPPMHDAATMMDASSSMDASTQPAAGTGGGVSPQLDAALTDSGSLGGLDAGMTLTPSRGGTITFQQIGASGWYPSRRDPASGECDAVQSDTCCMTRREIESDALTPWDEDLIMTLRGPMTVAQLAVYQPLAPSSGDWIRVAGWDARAAASGSGFSFDGDATLGAAFAGTVGSQCLVDVASSEAFPCGPGSVPYCPEASPPKHYGWSGSKLIVLLASMPHVGDAAIAAGAHCSTDSSDNWYDAPWIGLSHGELVRSGKFGDCHCYAKDPAMWWLGDGCGQLNAFEVVNDNNEAMNLDVFSSNFFGYQGYIGEGPCGAQCDVGALGSSGDLIDKATSSEAQAGAIATPSGGPGAAFVRPSREPRYFVMLFDAAARTVQLALISPASVPSVVDELLPALPDRVAATTVGALLALRLPAE